MLQSLEERCVFEMKLKLFKMADITGVLSLSHFRLTNIKVLSLLFTEYPFPLPSHASVTMFTKPSALTPVSEVLPLNKNEPEETDKMCRKINSHKGTL